MEVGGMAVDVPSFDGRITLSVIITCIVAATSGLIFGYDIGISGINIYKQIRKHQLILLL